MKVIATRSFEKDYATLPTITRDIADKKLLLFIQNTRHPSLRVKKMEGPRDIWEGSITMSYRFTFQIVGNAYILRRIGTHDILRRP